MVDYQREQQVAWYAEALVVRVMNGIEIVCYMFGKIARLLPGNAGLSVLFHIIVLEFHGLVAAFWKPSITAHDNMTKEYNPRKN